MANVPQHADSVGDPNDPSNDIQRIQQRHWIGVTPMDVETYKQGPLYPVLAIGHTVLRGERISSLALDGKAVRYDVRKTNRRQEVPVKASDGGEHTLMVMTS
jgi:hypothetical protein